MKVNHFLLIPFVLLLGVFLQFGVANAQAISPNTSGSNNEILLEDKDHTDSKIGEKYESFFNDLKNYLNNFLVNEKSLPVLIIVLLLVFVAGAFDALAPGHGKSMMSAYLVGRGKSKVSDVLLLSISTTVTHTIVIYVVGFALLYLDSKNLLLGKLPIFEKVSALIVLLVALSLIFNGISSFKKNKKGHENEEEHEHSHGLFHTHGSNKRNIITLVVTGISGGIVPCIDALALLLIAASAHQVLLGLIMVFIFSTGLGATMVLIGTLLIITKNKLPLSNKLEKVSVTYIPLISGIFLLILALKIIFN